MKRPSAVKPQVAGKNPGLESLGNGSARAKTALIYWSALSKKPWSPAAMVCFSVAAVGAGLGLFFHGRGLSYFPREQSEFLSTQELDRRLEQASQQLKADPADVHALLDSGILHYQKGKSFYPDGINELEEAWRLGAVDPRVFYYLGAMYQEEGLPQFAVVQYQRFLRNRPDDKDARLLLAKLLYQGERFDEALVQYQWYAQRYRKDPVVTENMAMCLLKLNRKEEAAQAFHELSSQKGPGNRRANYYLGQMAFNDQKYDQARGFFSHVLPVENDELGIPPAAVHAAIAANFEKLEQWDDAKTQWDDVLRFDPRDSRAKAGLRTAKTALKKAEKLKKNQ